MNRKAFGCPVSQSRVTRCGGRATSWSAIVVPRRLPSPVRAGPSYVGVRGAVWIPAQDLLGSCFEVGQVSVQ